MVGNEAHGLANWRQIAREIEERIGDGRLVDGDRLPSEFVLADEFGVSRGTVHRALSDLKVRGLVARQRRNGTVVTSAPRVRTGRVALVVDHANDFPQIDLVRGIQAGLPSEVGVLLFDAGGDAEREAEQLRRAANANGSGADGILIYPVGDPQNTPLLQSLAAAGLPIVCLDRTPDGFDGDAVLSDNRAVTLCGVRGLLASGHRRVAFLSGDNGHVSSVRERHDAYVEALGDGWDAALERWFPKELERKPDRLARAMEDALFTMLSTPEAPTAAFCVQDAYAAAAGEALAALGREGALEILTFNDWPPMMLRDAGRFRRIVQNPYAIGRTAAERLWRRLADPGLAPETVSIPADLFGGTPPFSSRAHAGRDIDQRRFTS